MSRPATLGTLVAVIDEVVRLAPDLEGVSGADIRRLADALQDASARLRLVASCADLDVIVHRPRMRPAGRRAA